jgi:hypothetical protein
MVVYATQHILLLLLLLKPLCLLGDVLLILRSLIQFSLFLDLLRVRDISDFIMVIIIRLAPKLTLSLRLLGEYIGSLGVIGLISVSVQLVLQCIIIIIVRISTRLSQFSIL